MAKANQQRERILRAAVRLFSQRGYHATSLKQLARQAGMTAPNLYHYYKSKEEILFEVHSVQLKRVIERQSELMENEPDPAERIRAFAYDLVHTDLEDPLAGFVPSNRLLGLRGNHAKVVREYMRTVRHQWVETIEDGVRRDVFDVHDPRLAALHALTLCSYVVTWFDAKGTYSKTDVAKEAAENCLRIFGYRSSP